MLSQVISRLKRKISAFKRNPLEVYIGSASTK